MATGVKIKIIVSFAGRLIVIIPLILHLLAIPPFYEITYGRKVSSYDMTRPYIYTQICLALSIITPTIPLLQPFMQATSTAFGTVSGEATNSYGDHMSRSKSQNGRSSQNDRSVFTQRETSSKMFVSGLKSDLDDEIRRESQDNTKQYSVSAIHDRRVSNSGSDISQQPMIRRDIQYTISYSDTPAS